MPTPPPAAIGSMTKQQFAQLLDTIQQAERLVREDGQREYAHADDNAFANFERGAAALGLTREQVLMVYLMKHMDGIVAYVRGHRSQREDIRGRIKDARLYLALLWGMIESEETTADEPPPGTEST
jgi:protoporphyrinogen oxidase